MKILGILIAAIAFTACSGAKKFKATGNSANSFGKCMDGGGIRFYWKSCGPNMIENTAIAEICSGGALIEDLMPNALQIKGVIAGQEKYECLFQNNDGGAELPKGDCDSRYLRHYSTVCGPLNTIDVEECNIEGKFQRYSGASLTGQPFSIEMVP